MSNELEILTTNRQNILLAEVGTLIHNIGKFSVAFVRKQGDDSSYQDFDHEPITGIIVDYVKSRGISISGKDRIKIRSLNDHATKQSLTQNLLETDFKDWIKSVDIPLPSPFDDRSYKLADFIDLQSQRLYPSQIQLLFGSSSRLTQLEAYSHGESSGLEKQESLLKAAYDGKEWKQAPDATYIASAFGTEARTIDLGSIDYQRKELLTRLRDLVSNRWPGTRSEILRHAEVLKTGLGDTRRPANDVTLWDFNYSTACLLKPAIATVLLNGWQEPDKLRWRMLRVNFDVLGLYGRAIKIADLLGYRKAIEEVCAAVKRLVEEEYPLGNEVYRDTTGIYFTFPDLDLPDELKTEIRECVEAIEPELAPRIHVPCDAEITGQGAQEQLKRLLADRQEQARKELAQPFTSETLSDVWQKEWAKRTDGKWELCPVCRLRPMRERDEACDTCRKRRASRIDIWKKEPARTIWMDEIADHNDRVALLVGKFGLDDWLSGDLVQTMLVKAVENDPSQCIPKNPSPARLRRVWETTQRFWEETVGKILKEHPYAGDAALRRARLVVVPNRKEGWEENVPYDGTINGGAVSLLWREAEGHFLTISNLQRSSLFLVEKRTEKQPAAGEARAAEELARDWRGRKVRVSKSDNLRRTPPFTVVEAKPAAGDLSSYAPYLPLLSSPDQFLALIPATDALDLAQKIHKTYTQEFGKVQNRLPIFLGLVFFSHKTPLMAVMDTARRMLEQVELTEETWQIKNVGGGKVVFESGVEWSVPVLMGDGCTCDKWYPYFFIEGDPGERKLHFQHSGHWLVHVEDLRPGDKVRVQPSRFAYLFLEHTAQRFDFDPGQDVILLDELPKLMEMWSKICNVEDMSDTKLRGVEDLLRVKGEIWGRGSYEWQHLIQTTLKGAGLLKNGAVTVEDVFHCRFERCLDLHLRILKRRVKKNQNGKGG